MEAKDPWSMLRVSLLAGMAITPLITGTLAVIAKCPNQWVGQYQGPLDAFIDYGTPIPVAAGCYQLFEWPLSFGVILLMTLFKRFYLFVAFTPIYLGAYVWWQVGEFKVCFDMYPVVNATVIMLVTTGWCATLWISQHKPGP